MKKRVLTMLLALILVLAALPVASLAAEPKTEPPELQKLFALTACTRLFSRE